jgi:SAM-dependent methyltransferase
MWRLAKRAAHAVGRRYVARIARDDAETRPHTWHNERPVEYGFALRQILKLAPSCILDVGTGTTAWPALLADCRCDVTAIDNVRDYWPSGMTNRHWPVRDHDIQDGPPPGGPYDLITCISVLEHIRDHRAAMRNMFAALKPGGHLVLCGPYTDREYVEDVYRAPGADPSAKANPYICRSHSRRELNLWLEDNGATLIEEECWITWTGRYWSQGERVAPPKPGLRDGHHTHACFLLRCS